MPSLSCVAKVQKERQNVIFHGRENRIHCRKIDRYRTACVPKAILLFIIMSIAERLGILSQANNRSCLHRE